MSSYGKLNIYLHHKFSILSLTLLLFSACTTKVLAPPAKYASTETPSVLKKGERKLSLEGGISAEIFGPALGTATFDYSKGLGNKKEISIRLVSGGFSEQTDKSDLPYMVGIAVDIKNNPSNKHFALLAGVVMLFLITHMCYQFMVVEYLAMRIDT